MGLKKFLTFSMLRKGKKKKDKKKKGKSLRDTKFVRHGATREKKRIMDEIGDI